MVKPPVPHAYTDAPAFERLMLLIAVIVQHPGIGASDSQSGQPDGLSQLLAQMQAIARDLQISIPNYSIYTLRKDLQTLRQYGILARRKHQSGYYLGTGAMTQEELCVAIQSLASQANQLGDPQAKRIYERVEKKLRGLNLDINGQLLYPVRLHLNQPIVDTDPQDMMRKGVHRHTLFFHHSAVEEAIVTGQALELFRTSNPHGTATVGPIQVYPLQFIFSEIAWYLLVEHCATGYLELERIDRLSDCLNPLPQPPRGIAAQQASLKAAHNLLHNGWGLYLGDLTAQRQERQGTLSLTRVKVRFYQPVMAFILEGARRHPRQTMRRGTQGDRPFVDYQVELPERSLNEFLRWVNRFMHHAKVLAPAEMATQHRENALKLAQLYE